MAPRSQARQNSAPRRRSSRGKRGTASPAEQRRKAIQSQWDDLAARARCNVNLFIALAFKNDQDLENNAPFEQQWFHREWQAAWQAHRITVLHGATGFGKTDQYVGRALWKLGNNPKWRLSIFGKKESNAQQRLLKIKRQIEENTIVRAIFPELRPGAVWNSETLRVHGAGIDTTTNSVHIFGIDGSPQGVRADEILLDDCDDFENTLSEHQRTQRVALIDATVQSRLTTQGQLHILANAWHPEDLAFTYAGRPGVWHGVYPAEDANGVPLWPTFRGRAWLEEVKRTTLPTQYCRMYLCVPRDDSTRVFKAAWIVTAKKRGAGIKPLRHVRHLVSRGAILDASALPFLSQAVSRSMMIVVGADLATKKNETKRKTDWNVLFTIGIHPNGDRQLLWITKARWGLDEKIENFADHDRRYSPELFFVEDNGMQADIVGYTQHITDFGARVVGFTTGTTKWHEENGIEGIGYEMKAGRWLVPGPADGETEEQYRASLTPEELEAYVLMNAWCQHLLDFARAQPHTDDDVMASYFAKEGARRMLGGVFSHDHGDEMMVAPEANVARVAAGNATTVERTIPSPQAPKALVPAHIQEQVSALWGNRSYP